MAELTLWQVLDSQVGELPAEAQMLFFVGCMQRCYPFSERYIAEHAE